MTEKQNIPLVDLKANLKPLKQEILRGMEAVLDKCNFILGEEVQQFETAFAQYCGTKHALGVASGLDAINLALRAVGVGHGDEVLVPANTFIATALGVTMCGAKPVVVEADPRTHFMDMNAAAKAITPKTKAALPVHLYGRMMDLDPLLELSKKHGFHVIEDAAQAHGAQLKGKRAGSVGSIGCFSFYPGKNLGCYGDGGGVVTNDPALKSKLESLRNYGSPKKYHHPIVGFNSRLDTLQAVVLKAKLPHLDGYNAARYELALKYNRALEGVGDLVLPEIPLKGSHVFHIYLVRTKKRDGLAQHLIANGIGATIHYPTPIHLHGAYADLGHRKGDFPQAEMLAEEIVSLPIFPELQDSQLQYVVDCVKRFYS